jgi:hypothetical protein
VTQPEDIVARIVAADAGHAAALVLALPWQQTRAVLAALGPREVARLLSGARADRIPDLVTHISPGLLSAVLAQLTVADIAQLVPLLPMDLATRMVQHMPAATGAELLLVLPTHQRLALQDALPRHAPEGEESEYPRRVEQAVRQICGRVLWSDLVTGSLLTEVFGRPVLVVAIDRSGSRFTASDLRGVVAGTDWRHIAGLVVTTNASVDPDVGAALREARQHGFLVEAVAWQDERDDGVLKRILVRLAS